MFTKEIQNNFINYDFFFIEKLIIRNKINIIKIFIPETMISLWY